MSDTQLQHILEHLEGMHPAQRQFGKTHAAAELVRRVGGVLLCRDRRDARRVAEQFGVRTDSIRTAELHAACDVPVVVDQDAFVSVCRDLLRRLREAERVAEEKLAAERAARKEAQRQHDRLWHAHAVLKDEHAKVEADLEAAIQALAGCSTAAIGYCREVPDQITTGRAAMQDVIQLYAKRERLEAVAEAAREFLWLQTWEPLTQQHEHYAEGTAGDALAKALAALDKGAP